jgi:hypothetical protein
MRLSTQNKNVFTASRAATLLAAATLSACASYGGMQEGMGKNAMAMAAPAAPAMFSQTALPAAVQVPAGHRVALETRADGQITYSCNAKANMAGQYEWVFVGPKATVKDRSQQNIGFYFGPPATWAHTDGSIVTGAQVAVAPSSAGNIPLQLVKANAKAQAGVYAETTYIQRVATVGGVAPTLPCGAGNMGEKQTVEYSADYIFWKAI